MIAGAFPELLGTAFVVAERDRRDVAQVLGGEPVVSQEAARDTSSGGASRRTGS
jgi:hypothetical protein